MLLFSQQKPKEPEKKVIKPSKAVAKVFGDESDVSAIKN